MKLSKYELLEILLNVIKHDYCLGKLGTILEIIDIYEPREEVHHPQRKLTEILLSDEEEDSICYSDNKSFVPFYEDDEEEEEPQENTTIIFSSDSDDSSDESSVAVYLTEGEEEK